MTVMDALIWMSFGLSGAFVVYRLVVVRQQFPADVPLITGFGVLGTLLMQYQNEPTLEHAALAAGMALMVIFFIYVFLTEAKNPFPKLEKGLKAVAWVGVGLLIYGFYPMAVSYL